VKAFLILFDLLLKLMNVAASQDRHQIPREARPDVG
jgi:hypothetical protein